MTPSARQMKRSKERETGGSKSGAPFYEKDEKYQYPVNEYEIHCSGEKNAQVWKYFGDLYHCGRIVSGDRVYCNPCLQNRKVDSNNFFFASLVHRIKHYAKSVSTGNLAVHLNDKHSIIISSTSSSINRSITKSRRSHNPCSRILKNSDNDSSTMDMSECHSTPIPASANNFASIDSSDEFDEDQEPSVIAKTIQKHAVDIIGQISTTESLTNLVHQFRALMRLARSNFRELLKSRLSGEVGFHSYLVSMQFLWNLVKSAIVLWKGLPDRSLSAYLEAIQFVYKSVPPDFRNDEEFEVLGHALILISGSVKCCDQSTLVLFAESLE